MNELIVGKINVVQGEIQFPEYENLKKQASEVAEYIKSIEVTEDSVKEAKKVLANANKAVKEIESRRIAIKKEMLLPYTDFEKQVKEIVGIVKDADNEVRSKVRELDEKEREAKKELIKKEWDVRTEDWEHSSIYKFEEFLEEQHLNKSVSIKKVTQEIEEFIAGKTKDISFLKSEYDDEYIAEYIKVGDVQDAIYNMNERKERLKAVESIDSEVDDFSEVKSRITIFIIEDEKDATFAETLMTLNGIKFKKEVK